jgi:hypothetical protein
MAIWQPHITIWAQLITVWRQHFTDLSQLDTILEQLLFVQLSTLMLWSRNRTNVGSLEITFFTPASKN